MKKCLTLITMTRRQRMLILLTAVVIPLLATNASAASHPFIENVNYTGTDLCLECHQPEYDLGDPAGELMTSVHWTWTHTNAPAGHAGQMMGKRNIINNYCIAVDSNEPRCTSCHIGSGWRNDSFDFNNPNNLDCLVCHDTTGTYKKTPAGAGAPDPTVNLVTVAQNVGPTSRATCGACHFYGGGGDAVKHGDLDSTLTNPTRNLDVHMGVDGANMTCADCHRSVEWGAGAHDLVGSRYSKPNPDNWLCEDCHTATPHKGGSQAERLNLHTSRVACQSCHVPHFARGGKATKMTWDWSTAGIKTNGATMQLKDSSGNVVYDTMKGSFTWASNVVPDYVWFNGDVIWTELNDTINPAQTVAINQLQGDASQARARIIPVKRFTAIQPYDAGSNTLAVPHLFALSASDTNAYWKGYNWTNALITGMTAAGRTFSGQMGWVETEMYWVQNHMVAPKENAVGCAECHTATGGRLNFEALGYAPERAAMLASPVLLTGADHTGRYGSNFVGSASCVQCHPNKIDEVMDSVHYLWRTTNSNLAYPGGGSHGMIDRFCGLVGSSAMVNYYADLAPYKDSGACGKCHVGDGLPFPSPQTGLFTQEQKDGIDCLVCHASEGNYDMTGDSLYDEHDIDTAHRLLTTNSVTGRRFWFQDRSLRAAESVGGPVGVAQCYRCHEHGQAAADYKRGTPFDADHDVHAAAGMKCTQCHLVDAHKMARGSRVTDMHAWERQDVEVSCANCHTEQPHTNVVMAAMYNKHAASVACETCHIPWTSGAARRVWAPTFGVTSGPEASIPIYDATNNVYKPYSDYTSAYNQRPAYRWYNGQDSMLAEPIHDVNAWDGQVASKSTPNAKIYAFRPIVNGMVMDGKGFGYNPNFDTNFTMLAAMDMMAGPLTQMGFMRPTGLTPQERAVLAQYPNLLNFDVETYIRTGDIQDAINVGLGRVGVMMSGQDAWGMSNEMLNTIGANFWSGEHIGLDMPNNPADPTFTGTDPTQPTGSFISLSHAVKRNGALTCADCHSATGAMDFAVLGYPTNQVAFLQSTLPWEGSDHTGRFPNGYTNATSCTVCHLEEAAQVMETSHWTWEHTDSITGRQFGKNHVVNNYCVSVAANEPRCTSCHVGVGYKDKNFNFADASKVDCLVCHDTTGTYKKIPTGAGSPDPMVNLNYVAQNVGKTSRATCGACHFNGGGGDAVKHGDLDTTLKNPDRSLDVHMGVNGGNFTCATCHMPATGTHEIPGTYYSKAHPDSQSCEACHTSAPHNGGTMAAQLNQHTARVGCQTCHIPAFARGRTTMMTWDWSTAGVKTNGQNFILRDANNDPIYDTQKGSFTWAKNVQPEYRWFNGTVDYLTVEDVINPAQRVKVNALHGDAADLNARILPVKRFTGRQPFDAGFNVLAVPNLFPNDATDTNAYWKGFNWTNAIASGMAYVGEPFSGQVGWVDTEFYWIENHMVAPKENALSCAQCHAESGGRLDFAALGYTPERTAVLQTVVSFKVGIDAAPAGVQLRWTGAPGYSYQVQSTTNLSDPNGWVDVPGAEFAPSATGELGWTNALPLLNESRFYRVMRTSP